jgi:hypothetical protein
MHVGASPRPHSECSTLDLESTPIARRQRREWLAERAGWALMAGLILAGMFGALGPGLFSARSVASSGGDVRVAFEPRERAESPAALQVYLRAPRSADAIVRLTISRSFTARVAIEEISPTPLAVEMSDDQSTYVFRAGTRLSRGLVTIRYKYPTPGRSEFDIGLEGRPAVHVSQAVLP